ncbi:uncharacterized protein LOC104440221 [Eucalyptus grandis]|uniref:uncharacterized protein LOC104440221 n=1 Tax=Eucalyptus grandis TaxID=71139 RepID=UPI00192EF7B7|nr:uncharacterized protein LOC104440221 [Eucalyptus grandis]
MATQPSEELRNSNHADPATEILEQEAKSHYYRPLLHAAFKGDWESAKRFFERDSASKTAKITSRSETALHIAAFSAQDHFVEKLVELLSPYPIALEEVDCDGCTALHVAVLCGRIRMVKALVGSNPKLTQLADNEGRVPLEISAIEASMHKEIAWFLAKRTTDDGSSHHPFSSPSAFKTMIGLTYAGYHDITLYLVGRYPHLITMRSRDPDGPYSILDALARMVFHFPSGTRLSFLEALIYKCIPVDLNSEPTNENSNPARSLWNAVKIHHPSPLERASNRAATLDVDPDGDHVASDHGQAITYFIALRNISLADTWGMLKHVTVVCWLCLMGVVFMGNVVRLCVWVLRKWGLLEEERGRIQMKTMKTSMSKCDGLCDNRVN